MRRIAECNVKVNLGLDNIIELLNQSNWEAPILQASCFVRLPVLLTLTAGLSQKPIMIPGSRFPERTLRACPLKGIAPLLSIKLLNPDEMLTHHKEASKN